MKDQQMKLNTKRLLLLLTYPALAVSCSSNVKIQDSYTVEYDQAKMVVGKAKTSGACDVCTTKFVKGDFIGEAWFNFILLRRACLWCVRKSARVIENKARSMNDYLRKLR